MYEFSKNSMFARTCREEGFKEDYPEQYLPDSLIERLNRENEWRDGDWWWGWNRVRATWTSDGAPKIQVANIAWGQGYATIRYWLPHEQRYIDENVQ